MARTEIELNKEVLDYKESIFFGLSLRQFICSLLAVIVAVTVYFSLRNILAAMSRYPQICQWIRKCIKQGTINEQSYRRLQDTYRSINIQGDKL